MFSTAYAAIAAAPLLLAFLLMVIWNAPASKSVGLAFLLTCVLALAVWRIEGVHVAAYTVYGVLKALDLLLIVGGAILLQNTLKANGLMDVIRGGFLQEVTGQVCLFLGIGGLLVPILLVAVLVLGFGPRERRLQSIVEMIPFSLLAALSFVIPDYLLGVYLGPEFASILGSILGMVLTVLAAQRGFLIPKYVWQFRGQTAAASGSSLPNPSWKQFALPGCPMWRFPSCWC